MDAAINDEKRKDLLIVSGLTLLGFLLRAAYVVNVHVLPYNDSAQWDQARLSILNGLPYTAAWPPFYPAFLALVTKLFGESYTVLNLGNAFLTSLTGLLIYFCAKEVFDKRTARLALLFSVLYADFIWYCGVLMGENLAVPLFTLLVYSVVKDRHPVVNGLLLGLTCMAKGLFILSAPALVFWLYYKYRNEGWLKKALLSGAVTVLTLLPWSIRTSAAYKDVVPIEPTLGCTIFDGHNPYATGGVDYLYVNYEYGRFYTDPAIPVAERERLCLKKAVEFALHNPWREVRLTLLKLSKQLSFTTSFVSYREDYPARKAMFVLALLQHLVLFPLCILGLAFSYRDRNVAGFAAIMAVFVGVFATLFTAEVRKRMPFVPLLLILAAHGAALLPGIIERVRKGEAGDLRRRLVVSAVLSSLLFLNLLFQVSTRYRDVLQRFQ